LVTTATLITSLPMSSISPEEESLLKELTEAIQLPEPVRTRRSITAFLAAEVLFLEGILAGQNSKKNTVNKVKGRRPVNNHIHSAGGSKHTYPPPVRQDTRPPTTSTTSTTSSTTSLPISQLDPFIMLAAPDLSRPKKGLQSYTDDIFTETVVKSETKDTKREVPLTYQQSKYGEYELYNPVIFAHSSDSEELSTSTALAPSSTINNSAARRPRKIVQKYGAFELYQPSFVIRQSKVKSKGKRDSTVSVIVTARPESLSSTFFTREQVGPDQEWRKVRRRRNV